MPCPGWRRTLAATYGLRKASLHGGLGAALLAAGHRRPGLERPSNAAKPRGLARCGAHGVPVHLRKAGAVTAQRPWPYLGALSAGSLSHGHAGRVGRHVPVCRRVSTRAHVYPRVVHG